MSDTGNISRRDFLKLGSGALALGILPRMPALPTIDVGIIGLGKQGLQLLAHLLLLPNIRLIGLCDVSQTALIAASEAVFASGFTRPRVTGDYRELLSWDLQAVVIATPDFSHTALALAALEAGKEIYLETPLTRSIQELETLRHTAQAVGCLLYADDRVSRDPRYAVAAELIGAGLLGKISRIHIVVNVPREEIFPDHDLTEKQVAWEQFLLYLPARAFHAPLLTRWQERQECSDGAAITQLAQALRIAHRVMRVSSPVSVTAHGGVYVWQDGRENPDTFYAILDYAEGFVVSFSMHPGSKANNIFALYGSRGALDLLTGQVTRDNAIDAPVSEEIASHAAEQFTRAAQSRSSQDVDLTGWLDAIRRRKIPTALLEDWSQQVIVAQKAAEAYRTGRRIIF